MRINAISIRLNYNSSWHNRALPGRNYNKHFIAIRTQLQPLLEKLFEHSIIRNYVLLGHSRYKYYTNKILLVNIYLYVYRYVEVYGKLKKKSDQKKIFLFYLQKTFCQSFLKKVNFWLQNSISKNKVKFNFVLVINKFFRAELISKYIINRLLNQFKIAKIVSSIGKNLVLSKKNSGMLVHCSGRFDRKERASYHIFSYGKTSLGNLQKKISFYRNEVTLKYGVCGVKVWLLKK